MKKNNRYETFCLMIEELDRGTYLINEYDSLLHDYNGVVMFQAESQMVKAIGDSPGITASRLAEQFKKTKSACSQLVRKLKKKGWIMQKRNEENSREYNLFLTETGKDIYSRHRDFEDSCYRRAFEMLSDITPDEMESYIKIQKRLNKAFEMDVSQSKKI